MQLTDAHPSVNLEGNKNAPSDRGKPAPESPSNEWSAVYSATFSVRDEKENTNFDQTFDGVKFLTVEFMQESIPSDQYLGGMVPGFEQQHSGEAHLIATAAMPHRLSTDLAQFTSITTDQGAAGLPSQSPSLQPSTEGFQLTGAMELEPQEGWTGKIDAIQGVTSESSNGDSSSVSVQSHTTPSMEPMPEPQSTSNKQPAQQVLDVTIDQISTAQKGEAKSLTFQLHPAELGQVTVVIDWSADSLNAKILVAEFGTRDLLLQSQPELIQALEEIDVGLGALEIGLQDSHQDNSENQRRTSAKLSVEQPEELANLTGIEAADGVVDGSVDVIV